MKITYDPTVDVLRILFQETPIAKSDEDAADIIFDYDVDENVVGLEVLSASKRVDDPQSRIIPLLLNQMEKLNLSGLVDEHFECHSNWQGLSLGKSAY